MDRLRYVPAPIDDADPEVLPFPTLIERQDDWQQTIKAVEELMATIEDDVTKLAEEMEADILPFFRDEDDWPPSAA